jgi:hypothetical protein
MLKQLLLIIFFNTLALFTFGQKANVFLYFSTTSDYCGGAAPYEGLLEELATPKPQASTTYYIIKGKLNYKNAKVIKTITTNDSGKVKLNLPPGTYSIITKTQKSAFKKEKNTENVIWDNTCRYNAWRSPVRTFTIKNKSIVDEKINTHINCFYNPNCGKYNGPMPA